MGIIEVTVAIFILIIVIIGGFMSFFHARGQVHVRKQSRAALHLACQKLEDLKAGNYTNITVGSSEENINLVDLACRRKIQTDLVDSCKKVKVTTFWHQKGREHSVSLVTYIAPD